MNVTQAASADRRLIRNALVHHRAVAIALHMCLKALMWPTPTNFTHLPRNRKTNIPTGETKEE